MQRKRTGGEATHTLDELWTVEDLAQYLKKPRSWVYENYQRYFDFYRVGREIRFDPDDIKSALRDRYRSRKFG